MARYKDDYAAFSAATKKTILEYDEDVRKLKIVIPENIKEIFAQVSSMSEYAVENV